MCLFSNVPSLKMFGSTAGMNSFWPFLSITTLSPDISLSFCVSDMPIGFSFKLVPCEESILRLPSPGPIDWTP